MGNIPVYAHHLGDQMSKISITVLETRIQPFWGRIHLASSSFWWLPALLDLWLHHASVEGQHLQVSLLHGPSTSSSVHVKGYVCLRLRSSQMIWDLISPL